MKRSLIPSATITMETLSVNCQIFTQRIASTKLMLDLWIVTHSLWLLWLQSFSSTAQNQIWLACLANNNMQTGRRGLWWLWEGNRCLSSCHIFQWSLKLSTSLKWDSTWPTNTTKHFSRSSKTSQNYWKTILSLTLWGTTSSSSTKMNISSMLNTTYRSTNGRRMLCGTQWDTMRSMYLLKWRSLSLTPQHILGGPRQNTCHSYAFWNLQVWRCSTLPWCVQPQQGEPSSNWLVWFWGT